MSNSSFLIQGGRVVNKGRIIQADVLIQNERIARIAPHGEINSDENTQVIDAKGMWVIPGMIDDQVHFREPGLTHKAEIYTEAKAAVAGGITSFMEMPNTIPQTLTQELLQDKYDRAEQVSLANYSFFMGASNHNLDEVLKTDPRNVCGVKVFMGSSTGDMLVDNRTTLEGLFKECPMLIATHCEDEATIRHNIKVYRERYGDEIPFSAHPLIRSAEACYKSSSLAVELAKKYNTRLHILHISTAKEVGLFQSDISLKDKRITAEACIHHLWFSDEDYPSKGAFIKWNPAVKTKSDRDAILQGVLDNAIDIIATDHAPHTFEEKSQGYLNAPSGGPLVQHALPALFELYSAGKISVEKIVEKTAHAVAECFQIEKRGYLEPGYFADIVCISENTPWTVGKENVLSKCGWSPFEGHRFESAVQHTFVSGHLAYSKGKFDESMKGKRLTFER